MLLNSSRAFLLNRDKLIGVYMYKIIRKEKLNQTVTLMEIEAPFAARRAEPGQFVILRVNENGERIPLTIADFNREKGTVTIIFQIVGATTELLNTKEDGEYLQDFAGPLGKPSDCDGLKKVCVVGGGVGNAIAYPTAKKLHNMGCDVTVIAGFKNKDLVILEKEFEAVCSRFVKVSDDGSWGEKGLVTDALRKLLEGGESFDEVIAIGPVIMMKFVCALTKEFNVKTVISMNPIMVDGTGMCGACRLTVGRETKFACVDGPDFDGHLVDFDEAMSRSSMYCEFERAKHEHVCNLLRKGEEA